MKEIEIYLFYGDFSAEPIFSCKHVKAFVGVSSKTNRHPQKTDIAVLAVSFGFGGAHSIRVIGDGKFVNEVKKLKKFVPTTEEKEPVSSEDFSQSFRNRALKVILNSLDEISLIDLIEECYNQGNDCGRTEMQREFQKFIGIK